MTQVDYLVLDLEGFEMEVLSAVPFDQLEIKFIQIEAAIPGSATIDPKLSAALRNFFTTKWPQYKEIDFTNGSDIDVAFINEKLQL